MSEYNYNNQSLEATQAAYKESTEYLERHPQVERYALFGAFRSDVSNIGPNATMLNDEGELTDIGLWYLDRKGVGAKPITRSPRSRSPAPTTIPGGVYQVVMALFAVTIVLIFSE